MKKLLSLLLVLVMLFSLAACGGGSKDDDDKDRDDVKQEEEKDDEDEDEDKNKDEDEDEDEDKDKDDDEDEGTDVSGETVVVDNDECLIKITDVDLEDDYGITMKVYTENKSDDKNYNFYLDSASVNGVVCSSYFSMDVESEDDDKEELLIYTDSLEYLEIDKYTDIELSFTVSDSDDWEADPVAEESVNIYPYGKKKAETFERDESDDDIEVCDESDFSAVIVEYEKDDFWGYSVMVYFENNSDDTDYYLHMDNGYINGVMCGSYDSYVIPAGKRALASFYFDTDMLEENGLNKITDVEIDIVVMDYNEYETVFEDKIHLYPYGESKATVFERESGPDDIVIVDNEYVTVTVTKLEYDDDPDYPSYYIYMFVENKSDFEIYLESENVEMDGNEADFWLYKSIPAEKLAFISMDWWPDEIDFEFADVEEITFDMVITNYDEYEELVTESITIEP